MGLNRSVSSIVLVAHEGKLRNLPEYILLDDFYVSTVQDERSAWDALLSHQPGIIVVDDEMCGFDVYSFCRRIKRHMNTSHIMVGLLLDRGADIPKGYKAGADFCFPKPIDQGAMVWHLRNLNQTRKNLVRFASTESLLQPPGIELVSDNEIFLKNAVEVINRYLHDPCFNVYQFSREMGFSPNLLYRKIKLLTGETVTEFIRNRRIKASAALLAQKKRTVSEISYMLGFTSPSYFSRRFREKYGCTPSEYVEKHS
ncbi:MAG: helix-turn-helix domain-containing protein [Breznakibacter sp.]